jgi:hypothetical protein
MRADLIGGSAVLAVLAVAVSVTGCGGGGSSSSETTASISKAEFVAKANAICAKGEKEQEAEINAYVKSHGLQNKRPTKAEQAEMVKAILAPNIQSQINAVTALGAPSGEERQVESAIQISQQTLDEGKANPSLFFTSEDIFAPAGKQLHALGLTKCAPSS